jgi:hypothetical protein
MSGLKPGPISGARARQQEKQIFGGNDRKNGKGKYNSNGNSKDKYRGPSLRSRMTAKNKQRQRHEKRQIPRRE